MAFKYTGEVVKAVLPLLFDSFHGLDGGLGLGGSAPEPGMPRAARDPSTVGELSCMCVDVAMGLRKVPVLWRNAMYGYYVKEQPVTALYGKLSVTEESMAIIVRDAPNVVADILNGKEYAFPRGQVRTAACIS